jgi:predicted kinase
MLIAMAGLPGCGKTTLAQKLAPKLNAVILSKDVLRRTLFPSELIEYSNEQDDLVIELLLQTAEYIWKKRSQQVVILDGRTFSRRSQRQRVQEFAKRRDQTFRIVECLCEEQVAKKRLVVGDPDHPAGNRTPELYDEVKARWQEITEPKLVVYTDTEIDLADLIRRIETAS